MILHISIANSPVMADTVVIQVAGASIDLLRYLERPPNELSLFDSNILRTLESATGTQTVQRRLDIRLGGVAETVAASRPERTPPRGSLDRVGPA